MKIRIRSFPLFLVVGLLGGLGSREGAAAPLGSAFSYQGRLLEGGVPAHGRYDLLVTLLSEPVGGSPQGAPVTNAGVVVSNGVFTTLLDFGTSVFSGAGCWLEMGVRRTGAVEDFTTLSPRQPLTPAPYSLYTLQAGSLSGPLADAQLSTNVARLDADQAFRGAVTFRGRVQVGDSNATADLDVQGAVQATSLRGDGAGLSNVTAAALSARSMQRLWRVSIPFVTVTNAGNMPDFTGKGAVAWDYRIGKFEVNNHQYAVFLNAVGAEDAHSLYSTNMAGTVHGGIVRSGSPGDYAYAVKPGLGHRPVVWVDFYDALRFCNWLHHGQPAGPQDATTTEDGAYRLTPEALAAQNILRNPGARYWLPSDDEWYKAAYHQPLDAGGDPSDYWRYPTRSNDTPISELPPGGVNSVNACCDTDRNATDVGAYLLAPSFYGAFDMAGNVQEWTEFTTEFALLNNRRVRGGSWYYNEFYGQSTDFEFDTTDYDAEAIGFRVAGVAEP